jgi:predicted naringenin-chalcone synthase
MLAPAAHRAYVNRIGCAVPEHDIHEGFVGIAPSLFGDARLQEIFGKMAQRADIAHRYSTLALGERDSGAIDRDGFYRRGEFPATGARMRRYADGALPLALAAIADLGAVDFSRITHVIVASCTGFTAPGMDVQLIEALGLPKTVFRTLVGFMGCAAAVPALRTASDIVLAHPQARVLVVNTELCTLHFQDTQDLQTVLSFLLFGDGASAALVTAEPRGVALDQFRTTLIPDSAGLITWHIGDSGFDMHLSGAVPLTVARALAAAAASPDLAGLMQGLPTAAITQWAVHPGGRSVLDSVERALGLAPEDLAVSRSVLSDFGNMSSATVMFALRRIMEKADTGERGMAMAFGPGVVAESFQFEIA